MSFRPRKRKNGGVQEWDDSSLNMPGAFSTATKHRDEHIQVTGNSTSTSYISLGPSPRKPKPKPRYMGDDEGLFSVAPDTALVDNVLDWSTSILNNSDDDDDDDDDPGPDPDHPELEISTHEQFHELTPESLPELEPSPYDVVWEDEPGGRIGGEEAEAKRARKETASPLSAFIDQIDSFVDELCRLEAPEPNVKEPKCNECRNLLATNHFRCRDCPSTAIWCQECVVKVHSRASFHRLERWNNKFYERVTLKSLGLRVQLGHTHGTSCRFPEPGPKDFVVIDSDGIQEVAIDYCGCHKKGTHVEQLLRARLFPASCTTPKTAATFRVLETFQMLSFTAKTSAYEFLAALRRRTNNVTPMNDRYREFLRMIHMWRHVRLLKRTGRGHDPLGVANTKPGECALLCPACPQVGINLPEDWQDRAISWVYALFLAIDANFRLKRKDVSNSDKDPCLNRGFAYMVDETRFREHREAHARTTIEDKSTCNNHDAIKSASIRGGKGLAATGLGTCQCSRHDMKRPQGSGDLQRGEQYLVMDWFFISTLAFFIPFLLVVTYDIACQWSKKLKSRCDQYISNPVKENRVQIKFAVPKFHLPAHIQVCRDNFNLNYTPHVGRTDGEAPERGWSSSNDLVYSTRQMGPGSRSDTIDDAYGHNNWTKSSSMDEQLSEKASEAIMHRAEQVSAFEDFAASIDDKLVQEWTSEIQRWEADPSQDNPFQSSGEGITEASVRSEMADEDTTAISEGKFKDLHSDLTPSQFILQGIEIEESIRKHLISLKGLGPASTTVQRTRLIQAGNMLRRRFDSWEGMQRVYMPSVLAYREKGDGDVGAAPGAATQVKDLRLLLPSDLVNIEGMSISTKLSRYEFRMRIAQAHSSLRELRGLLLWRSQRLISKKAYSHGTTMITRSNALIQGISEKIRNMAAKYRRVRVRLRALGRVLDETEWRKVLKKLKDGHLRSLTSFDVGCGDGSRKLSWIWNVHSDTKGASAAVVDALRIEFCRARARAHRWQEECILLNEEIRRVNQFWEHDAKKWTDRAAQYTTMLGERLPPSELTAQFPLLVEDEHNERVQFFYGKIAYAQRQAALRLELRDRVTRATAQLLVPLVRFDKGGGVVVDGTVMVEGKGLTKEKKRKKSKKSNKDTK